MTRKTPEFRAPLHPVSRPGAKTRGFLGFRGRGLYLGPCPPHIAAMAILEIARMGAATLRQPAEPVGDPSAPEIRALVEDMFETMREAGGVGLAAPQVRVPLRLVIFQLPAGRMAEDADGEGEDEGTGDGEGEAAGADDGAADDGAADDGAEVPLHVFINPVITPIGDEQALGWEGCLSLPGMRGLVPRHTRIRYSAFNLDGELVEGEASGFHARVIQHECDHLDGLVYPMRMTDLSLLGYDSEWARAMREDIDAAAREEGEEARR